MANAGPARHKTGRAGAAYAGPVRRLLEPSTLTPLPVDLRRVILAGVLAWLVALIVIGVLALTGTTTGRGVWVCLTGMLLGGLGLVWERRRARRLSA